MSMYGKPNRKGELKCEDESRTKQSFEEESNINVIFARAIRNGWDPRLLPQVESQFADVSQVGDFRDAQERILRGNEIFMQLSAQDRLQFGNDPAAFFEFASDPANQDAVTELRFGKEALNEVRAKRGSAAGVPGGESPGGSPGASSVVPGAGGPARSGSDGGSAASAAGQGSPG